MRAWAYLLLFFFAPLFDWAWSRYLPIGGMAPSWLWVGVLALAAVEGPVPAQVIGFFWGLWLDALGVHAFGANAFLFTLLAYGVGRGRRLLDLYDVLAQSLVAGLLTLLSFPAMAALTAFSDGQALWPGWRVFFGLPLFNAAAAPLVFALLARRRR